MKILAILIITMSFVGCSKKEKVQTDDSSNSSSTPEQILYVDETTESSGITGTVYTGEIAEEITLPAIDLGATLDPYISIRVLNADGDHVLLTEDSNGNEVVQIIMPKIVLPFAGECYYEIKNTGNDWKVTILLKGTQPALYQSFDCDDERFNYGFDFCGQDKIEVKVVRGTDAICDFAMQEPNQYQGGQMINLSEKDGADLMIDGCGLNSFCFNDENTDISRLGANEFEFYTNYVLGFNKKFQLIQKRGDIWPIFLNNSFAQWSLSNL